MTDVVYKIGPGCEWHGHQELRYSIRSVVENFQDLGQIYIVGFKPNWLENVIHLPLSDCYKSNKDANLINKLILACSKQELSEHFLNMSDDNYFLNKVDKSFFEVPIINNSEFNFAPNQNLNKWQMRLARSKKVLTGFGFNYDCFDVHIPCMINKHLYPKTLLNYDYGYDVGYVGNTLYFNSINSPRQVITNNILLRYREAPTTIEIIEKESINKIFLNFTSKVINNSSSIKFFLEKKFPIKSKYEM